MRSRAHPNRPNPVGMSVVRLAERKGRVLRLEGIDVLDGTPLIEMKPRVSSFGHRADVRMGWPRGKA